ncbi:hypothetical protein DL96DRAFT_1685119 [Flagelloscypha sp. PMI_526]|nr:hypothetical protein DL96DRAFT_1685119 [Flagelloscypha sp. PMI_526]
MYLSLVVGGLALLSPIKAACTSPRQRKDWTSLTDAEKASYISAVRCLHSVAPVSGFQGSTSIFEDFAGTHIDQHRYMMWAYESALITDCGYTGAQPYWNETKDAGAFTKSALLQANDLSFGGDGVASNSNCVSTGPFANLTIHVGPGSQITNHCLNRAISDRSSQSAGQSYVNTCMAKTTFSEAWPCIENNGLHPAGHGGVGAEMINVQSAPVDPIFYMHHTWIDKLWYDWQQASPSTRTNDIAGCTTQGMAMSMAGITPAVTVGDVMNTQGDYLCYTYV